MVGVEIERRLRGCRDGVEELVVVDSRLLAIGRFNRIEEHVVVDFRLPAIGRC